MRGRCIHAAARALKRGLRGLLRRQDGSIAVETVLMAPLLFWCLLGGHVYFEVFRVKTLNTKTAYMIGDYVSRESRELNDGFLDSTYALQGFLMGDERPRRLRVTSYEAAANGYRVLWSQTRGAGIAPLTNAGLRRTEDALPLMAEAERAILVETWVEYEPAFGVGLGTQLFREFVVTRPRFNGGQICFNTSRDLRIETRQC